MLLNFWQNKEATKILKDILEAGTKEDLEAKSKDLMDSLQKLGSSFYQKPDQTAPETSDGKEEKSDKPEKSDKTDKDKPEEGEVVN